MQAYCGWKQREDLLLSFRRSIGALRVGERRSPGAAREARAYNTIVVAGYAALHLGCLAAFWTGVSLTAVMLLGVGFLIRSFSVSIVYHRYLAHRAFSTSRL